MVIPYVSLKPVRDQLRSRVQTGDGNEESDKVWRHMLADAVRDADLTMHVVLGRLQLSLNELEGLKEGDILPFKKNEHARVTIHDLPVFDVEIGSRGAQVAVKVVNAISPSAEQYNRSPHE